MGTAAIPPLLLLRHGQPQGVRPKSFLGHRDPDLNAEGRAQALAQAALIPQRIAAGQCPQVAVTWCSDLLRAQSTAAPVVSALGCPLRLDGALREINFGSWEGLTFAEVDAQQGGAASRWFEDPEATRPEQGESLAQVFARVAACCERICQGDGPGARLVVGHFGSLAMVAAWALGLQPRQGLRLVLQRGQCGLILEGRVAWWGLP